MSDRDLLERLREESLQLARRSFDSVDAGLSANLCDEAIGEIEHLRSQLGKATSPLNAIQFIALLEVLEECAIFVPGELEARVYNLLDYHRDHDTASKLSHPDD